MGDQNYDHGNVGETNSAAGTAGTATAPAPTTGASKTLQVVKNEEGDVKIGVWTIPPDGYTALTTREAILDSLGVFTRTDLANKIADACLY